MVKILLEIIGKETFNIKDKIFEFRDYKFLIDIFVELIISYYSDNNSKNNNPDKQNIKYIDDIINKIFLPILQNNDDLFNISQREILISKIEEKLFTSRNIKLIFLEPIKELSVKFYNIFLSIIKKNKKDNKKENNSKIQELITKIINSGENISPYLYKILLELIIINNEENEIDNITMESFMPIYYKINKETDENLKEIKEIFIYLINKKQIFSKKKEIIQEIKLQLNDNFIKNLFDSLFEVLNILIKTLQYNDEAFSQNFNLNDIQKLYTYCLKCEDKKIKREKQIKLMKLIFGILEINDKFTPNRIKILLGYPTMIIRKDKEKNISLFGASIMNNNINIEIFKYISWNHIKKERCVLGIMFPSSQEKNEENYFDENDRIDLIYELLKRSLGLNEINEGNYFLFKYIYLMQTRTINYENLYLEMIQILENANKTNNNKYNIEKRKKVAKECIKLINYEIEDEYNSIKLSLRKNLSKEENGKNNLKVKPELPECFKSNKDLINEKKNKEFIGVICDLIPHEIGKIEIILVASGKNLSIFRFEYFTTYYTKKEIQTFTEEKKEFSYIKRESDPENNIENDDENLIHDISILSEKNEKDFILYIDENLKEKQSVILINKEVLNEKQIKSSLIRYYILSKKNNILKIEIIKGEMDKDIKNNYDLPEQIVCNVEENQISNIINIHRIKNDFNFLKPENIGLSIKTSNAEKYFKEYME